MVLQIFVKKATAVGLNGYVTHEEAQQDLNMNSHVISNVPNPVNSQDAVNKQYVDQNNICFSTSK